MTTWRYVLAYRASINGTAHYFFFPSLNQLLLDVLVHHAATYNNGYKRETNMTTTNTITFSIFVSSLLYFFVSQQSQTRNLTSNLFAEKQFYKNFDQPYYNVIKKFNPANKDKDKDGQGDINDVPNNNNNKKSTITNTNPYAYVFLIYGCKPELELASYRAYMTHILASAKLLKEFNSTTQADIVAMIKMSQNSNQTKLLSKEEEMLSKSGIKIKYLPQTKDKWQETDNFMIKQLVKVHLLNLTEYERILFMDADILPLANLDYLFKLSHGPNAIFKDNIIISSNRVPMVGGFFVLKPNATGYQIMLDKINEKQRENKLGSKKFDKFHGWGHTFVNDSWTSNNGMDGKTWNYHGGYSDQGLLYYYPKYLQKSLTQILSRKILNFGPGPNNTVIIEKNWNTKRLKNSPLYKYSKKHYKFERPDCKRVTRGNCVPPYRDHAHFMDKMKPWLKPPTPTHDDLWNTTKPLTATRVWWQTVGRLQIEDGINITSLLSGSSELLQQSLQKESWIEALHMQSVSNEVTHQ